MPAQACAPMHPQAFRDPPAPLPPQPANPTRLQHPRLVRGTKQIEAKKEERAATNEEPPSFLGVICVYRSCRHPSFLVLNATSAGFSETPRATGLSCRRLQGGLDFPCSGLILKFGKIEGLGLQGFRCWGLVLRVAVCVWAGERAWGFNCVDGGFGFRMRKDI